MDAEFSEFYIITTVVESTTNELRSTVGGVCQL